MEQYDINMSLTPPSRMSAGERISLTVATLGLLGILVSFLGAGHSYLMPFLFGLVMLVVGGVLYTTKRHQYKSLAGVLFAAGIISLLFLKIKLEIPAVYLGPAITVFLLAGGIAFFWFRFGRGPAGIRNDGIYHSEVTRKGGTIAWFLGILFTGFYITLYWFPENLHGLIYATEPLYHALTGKYAIYYAEDGSVTGYNQWFLYGLFYTLAVIIMGTRFMFKYRHNRYQLIRTVSVTVVQLFIAFLLPSFLEALNNQGQSVEPFYFSYFWPLDYDALFPSSLSHYAYSPGMFGKFVFYWMIIGAFVAVPVLTYLIGKRWYCSWVCGCGGLAETAGDPFRHLSDKSLKAWRIERISIYSVLVLITLITALLLVNWRWPFMDEQLALSLKKGYGFAIGSVFAGVVGTGFYPLLGNRVWCRFGCPQAAILGIIQKYFSRFRITTNGAQCISCGNCSTYCEMGIDVKWYAQRGQNIVRASCVGCGVCSAVCPRGVLKLETGPVEGRTEFTLDSAAMKFYA